MQCRLRKLCERFYHSESECSTIYEILPWYGEAEKELLLFLSPKENTFPNTFRMQREEAPELSQIWSIRSVQNLP